MKIFNTNEQQQVVIEPVEQTISPEERMLWLQVGLDLEKRSFELRGVVDDSMTAFTLRCLTKLCDMGRAPITIYLNSPGGSVTDGFAIYDLIEECPCEVTVVAFGMVGSMAPIVMLAADKRYALSRTQFMVHSPMFMTERETSVDHHMDDAIDGIKCKSLMLKILAKRTKKPLQWWKEKMNRKDFTFGLKQALEYGILTPTVSSKKEKTNVKKAKRKNRNKV
jgi:ATP-dependent Clp protease protease subunit